MVKTRVRGELWGRVLHNRKHCECPPFNSLCSISEVKCAQIISKHRSTENTRIYFFSPSNMGKRRTRQTTPTVFLAHCNSRTRSSSTFACAIWCCLFSSAISLRIACRLDSRDSRSGSGKVVDWLGGPLSGPVPLLDRPVEEFVGGRLNLWSKCGGGAGRNWVGSKLDPDGDMTCSDGDVIKVLLEEEALQWSRTGVVLTAKHLQR